MSIDVVEIVNELSRVDKRPLRRFQRRRRVGELTRARIIRYALGIALAIALAYGVRWPLSYLTPLLCAVILARPLPVLPLKVGFINMVVTLFAFLFGFFFTQLLLPFPLVYSLALAVVLFRIYYYLNRNGSFWLTIMLLLSVLMMPLLSSINEGLAIGVVVGFLVSSWLTILILWLVHYIVPDPEAVSMPPRRVLQKAYSFHAAQAAMKSAIVVTPLALLFIAGNWVNQILVLIFAAIFTLVPDLEEGRDAGIASFISTLIGGLFAMILYILMVAVPEFYFYVLLIFAVSMIFGTIIFSDSPAAIYYPSAMTGMIVLLNSSMELGSSFSETFFVRLGLILLATVYVVFALKILNIFWPEKYYSQGTSD